MFVSLDPFWFTMVKPFFKATGEKSDEEAQGDRWSWTLGEMQYRWLKETLENSSAKYKFIFIHHLTGGAESTNPALSTGYGRGGAEVADLFDWGGRDEAGVWRFGERRSLDDGWTSPIHQLLVENGVTIVFHGHDHLFAKETLDNIVYQECPRPCDTRSTISDIARDTYVGAIENGDALPNSGHLRVTVSSEKVTVDYVRTNNANEEYSYTIDATPSNTPPMVSDIEVSTCENASLDLVLTADDKQKDSIIFEVLKQPNNGLLTGDGSVLSRAIALKR